MKKLSTDYDEYTCTECGNHGKFPSGLTQIRCSKCGRTLIPVKAPTPAPFEPSEFQRWLVTGAGLSADEVKALQSNQGYYNLVRRAYFAKEVAAEVEAAYVQKQLDEDAQIDEAWERAADEACRENDNAETN